jgi:hypothetical protein
VRAGIFLPHGFHDALLAGRTIFSRPRLLHVAAMSTPSICGKIPIQWNSSLTQIRDIKVVLVYEEFQMGIKGKEIFDLIAREAGENAARLTVWRFDFIHSAELTRAVTHQAEEADVIIVAPRNLESLPPQVRLWLEQWPMNRRNLGGALIAVFDSNVATSATPSNVAMLLWRAAQRAGMDYFFYKAPVAENAFSSAAAAIMSASQGLGGYFPANRQVHASPHGGIND